MDYLHDMFSVGTNWLKLVTKKTRYKERRSVKEIRCVPDIGTDRCQGTTVSKVLGIHWSQVMPEKAKRMYDRLEFLDFVAPTWHSHRRMRVFLVGRGTLVGSGNVQTNNHKYHHWKINREHIMYTYLFFRIKCLLTI